MGTEKLDSFSINGEEIGECIKLTYIFKTKNNQITTKNLSDKLWYELVLKDVNKNDGSLYEGLNLTDDLKESLNKFSNS